MHNFHQRRLIRKNLQHIDLKVKNQFEAYRNFRNVTVRMCGLFSDRCIMRIARITCIIVPFFGVLHA